MIVKNSMASELKEYVASLHKEEKTYEALIFNIYNNMQKSAEKINSSECITNLEKLYKYQNAFLRISNNNDNYRKKFTKKLSRKDFKNAHKNIDNINLGLDNIRDIMLDINHVIARLDNTLVTHPLKTKLTI